MHSPLQSARARFLALPAHLIAILCMLTPVFGVLLASGSSGSEGIMRRARMVTLGVDAGLWVLIGLFLGMAVATLFDQRKLRWTYTVIAAVGGLMVLLVLPVFLMDIIQLRGTVRPEVLSLYDGNMARNLLTLLLSGLVFIFIAISSFRAMRRDSRDTGARPGLVGVGGQMRRAPAPGPVVNPRA